MPNPIADRRLRSFLIPAIVILALALVAAACGGDDGDGGGGTPTSTATPTPTETPTPEPTPAETPTPEPTPIGTTFEIRMVPSITFDTDELTVPAGTEVTVSFDNQDTSNFHNWAVYTDDSASEALGGATENICQAPCTGEVTFGPLAAGEYFSNVMSTPSTCSGPSSSSRSENVTKSFQRSSLWPLTAAIGVGIALAGVVVSAVIADAASLARIATIVVGGSILMQPYCNDVATWIDSPGVKPSVPSGPEELLPKILRPG